MRHLPWLVLILAVGCTTKTPAAKEKAPEAAGEKPAFATSEWQRLRTQLPATPAQPVTDTYFGTKVTDPYRWLEDGKSPEVQAWMKKQNEVARTFLDRIPGEKAIAARIREILTAKTIRWGAPKPAGGRIFAMKSEPPKQQPFLVVADSPDAVDEARVLVDPNAIDPGGHTAIDWFVPSPDGKIVAVSLSKSGTESGDLHFFDVATGKEKYESIPRVQIGTAGGDAAWSRDGKGVYYTRYPRAGERKGEDASFYQQLYYHRLGTKVAKDHYELGKKLPRIAEIRTITDPTSRRVLALVQEGDSGRFRHYLRDARGRWHPLTTYADRITGAEFGPDGSLYLLSLKDAPRGRILRLAKNARRLAQAKVVVPEQDGAVQWDFYTGDTFVPTKDRLYVAFQVGGSTTMRAFALPSGKSAKGPSVPDVSTVGGLRLVKGEGVMFNQTSYTRPPAWYVYDPAKDATRVTAMRTDSPVSFDDVEVAMHFAVSKDGSKVPFAVVMKKGTPKDGNVPALVTGYGGYGISMSPGFNATNRVWLDHGGMFVEVGVRGGGEYGEAWHEQGSGVHKQNTFDDFAAALQWLVDNGYTKPERIGIIGGSNGGILMGAMITQHPAMQKVVVSAVGVYDMLRNELTPNGQFNVPEYGSVKNEAQFRAMYAYSPYQHVTKGTAYPAVLLTAGANDPRVDPMHSRKFAAALQAASTSGQPVLLRVDYAAGHGLDTKLDSRIETSAHINAFLMTELGMLDTAEAAPAAAPTAAAGPEAAPGAPAK